MCGFGSSDGMAVYGEREPPKKKEGRIVMLYTLAVVMLILWLLGLITSNTMGGFIHVLLVIAIVVILIRVISGRRVV